MTSIALVAMMVHASQLKRGMYKNTMNYALQSKEKILIVDVMEIMTVMMRQMRSIVKRLLYPSPTILRFHHLQRMRLI